MLDSETIKNAINKLPDSIQIPKKSILKGLFCKHKYNNQLLMSLTEEYIVDICEKCGKRKNKKTIKDNRIYETEHALNKNWYIG